MANDRKSITDVSEEHELVVYKTLLSEFTINSEIVKNNYMPYSSMKSFIKDISARDMVGLQDIPKMQTPCWLVKGNVNFPPNYKFEIEYLNNCTYSNYQGDQIFFHCTAEDSFLTQDVFIIYIQNKEMKKRLVPSIRAIKRALKQSNVKKAELCEEYKKTEKGIKHVLREACSDIKYDIDHIIGNTYSAIECTTGHGFISYIAKESYSNKLCRLNIDADIVQVSFFAEDPVIHEQIEEMLAPLLKLAMEHDALQIVKTLKGK